MKLSSISALIALVAWGCGSESPSGSPDASAIDAGIDAAGCALTAATSPTGTVTSGCALLDLCRPAPAPSRRGF
jgi:hypothetical protein